MHMMFSRQLGHWCLTHFILVEDILYPFWLSDNNTLIMFNFIRRVSKADTSNVKRRHKTSIRKVCQSDTLKCTSAKWAPHLRCCKGLPFCGLTYNFHHTFTFCFLVSSVTFFVINSRCLVNISFYLFSIWPHQLDYELPEEKDNDFSSLSPEPLPNAADILDVKCTFVGG